MFVWFVIGCFAVWRLTWDLTSCSREIDPKTGLPIGECEANLEGPFRTYDLIRNWVSTRTWMPDWVDITCPFCVSMWVAGFFALLLLVDGSIPRTIAAWLLYTIGMSAPTALVLRYMKSIYGVLPREF